MSKTSQMSQTPLDVTLAHIICSRRGYGSKTTDASGDFTQFAAYVLNNKFLKYYDLILASIYRLNVKNSAALFNKYVEGKEVTQDNVISQIFNDIKMELVQSIPVVVSILGSVTDVDMINRLLSLYIDNNKFNDLSMFILDNKVQGLYDVIATRYSFLPDDTLKHYINIIIEVHPNYLYTIIVSEIKDIINVDNNKYFDKSDNIIIESEPFKAIFMMMDSPNYNSRIMSVIEDRLFNQVPPNQVPPKLYLGFLDCVIRKNSTRGFRLILNEISLYPPPSILKLIISVINNKNDAIQREIISKLSDVQIEALLLHLIQKPAEEDQAHELLRCQNIGYILRLSHLTDPQSWFTRINAVLAKKDTLNELTTVAIKNNISDFYYLITTSFERLDPAIQKLVIEKITNPMISNIDLKKYKTIKTGQLDPVIEEAKRKVDDSIVRLRLMLLNNSLKTNEKVILALAKDLLPLNTDAAYGFYIDLLKQIENNHAPNYDILDVNNNCLPDIDLSEKSPLKFDPDLFVQYVIKNKKQSIYKIITQLFNSVPLFDSLSEDTKYLIIIEMAKNYNGKLKNIIIKFKNLNDKIYNIGIINFGKIFENINVVKSEGKQSDVALSPDLIYLSVVNVSLSFLRDPPFHAQLVEHFVKKLEEIGRANIKLDEDPVYIGMNRIAMTAIENNLTVLFSKNQSFKLDKFSIDVKKALFIYAFKNIDFILAGKFANTHEWKAPPNIWRELSYDQKKMLAQGVILHKDNLTTDVIGWLVKDYNGNDKNLENELVHLFLYNTIVLNKFVIYDEILKVYPQYANDPQFKFEAVVKNGLTLENKTISTQEIDAVVLDAKQNYEAHKSKKKYEAQIEENRLQLEQRLHPAIDINFSSNINPNLASINIDANKSNMFKTNVFLSSDKREVYVISQHDYQVIMKLKFELLNKAKIEGKPFKSYYFEPDTIPGTTTLQIPICIDESGKLIAILKGRALQPGEKNAAILGEGSFGQVWLGMDIETGQQIAVKFPKNTIVTNTSAHDAVKIEMQILADVGRLVSSVEKNETPYEVIPIVVDKLAWGRNYFNQYELLNLQRSSYSEDDIICYKINMLIQAFKEIQKLHDRGYVHRDIKLENMVWDDKVKQAVIVDFGLSKKIDLLDPNVDGVVGTRGYMANEVYKRQYSKASDIFACGVMLIELISNDYDQKFDADLKALLQGFNPNNNDHIVLFTNHYLNNIRYFQNVIILKPLVQLIETMLKPDPKDRGVLVDHIKLLEKHKNALELQIFETKVLNSNNTKSFKLIPDYIQNNDILNKFLINPNLKGPALTARKLEVKSFLTRVKPPYSLYLLFDYAANALKNPDKPDHRFDAFVSKDMLIDILNTAGAKKSKMLDKSDESSQFPALLNKYIELAALKEAHDLKYNVPVGSTGVMEELKNVVCLNLDSIIGYKIDNFNQDPNAPNINILLNNLNANVHDINLQLNKQIEMLPTIMSQLSKMENKVTAAQYLEEIKNKVFTVMENARKLEKTMIQKVPNYATSSSYKLLGSNIKLLSEIRNNYALEGFQA